MKCTNIASIAANVLRVTRRTCPTHKEVTNIIPTIVIMNTTNMNSIAKRGMDGMFETICRLEIMFTLFMKLSPKLQALNVSPYVKYSGNISILTVKK